MKMVRLYGKALDSRPLLTKMVTSSVIFAIADLVQTKIEAYYSGLPFSLSLLRLFKSAAVGGLCAAPTLHFWYSRTLPGIVPQKSVIRKTLLDQAIFAPYFLLFLLGSRCFVRGNSVSETKSRISKEFNRDIIENWKFWPLAQFLNFLLIPMKFQILYVNVLGVAWQSYLTRLSIILS